MEAIKEKIGNIIPHSVFVALGNETEVSKIKCSPPQTQPYIFQAVSTKNISALFDYQYI